MWGGVASSAAARREPRSMVAGSTLPSQSQEEEVREEGVVKMVVAVDELLAGGEI